eukprot:6465907-Amphidinium_carterae.3
MQVVVTGADTEVYQQKRHTYESEFPPIAGKRKHNRVVLSCVDRALAKMGVKLSAFRVAEMPRPLREGERRRVAMLDIRGEKLPRSIVCCAGKERVELKRQYIDGVLNEPVLHLFADQGGVGLQAVHWLTSHLRATFMPDMLHRLHNDVVLAERECCMLDLRLECKIALGMRHGSWNSNANANSASVFAQGIESEV